MDSIPDVLNFIKRKYCKEDLVLGMLIGQIKELREPRNINQSLANIERFLITFSHLVEWSLQRNFNSKSRMEIIPLIFALAIHSRNL